LQKQVVESVVDPNLQYL